MAAPKKAAKKAPAKKASAKKAPAKKAAAKKKKAAPKKAAAKRYTATKAATKRAAPRAAAKTMTKSEAEALVVKIVSIYWEQFGRGAGLPVEPACFDRAVEMGALGNVRKNLKELAKFGAVFKQAEGCSLKAGKRAKKLANETKPKTKTITPDIYEEAFLYVANSIDRAVRRRGLTTAQKNVLGQQGILC